MKSLVGVALILAASYATAQPARLYLLEAEAALGRGDTLSAVDHFLNVLESDPGNFTASLRLSEIYFDLKNWSRAATYANISVDLLNEKAKTMTVATYSRNEGDDFYLDNYREYQRLKRDLASVYHLKAKIRMRQNNFYSALTDLDSAFEYAPGDADIQVDAGLAHMKMGQPDEAVNHFFFALDVEPGNYKALYNLGLARLQEKDTLSALEFMQLSVRNYDSLAIAWKLIGDLQMDMQNHEDAADAYTHAIRLDPMATRELSRRAYAYSQTGQAAKAADDWEKVYSADSKQTEAIRNAGLARMSAKDYAHAILNFSQYIHHRPSDPAGYLNRGYAYVLQTEYKAGIRDLEAAVRLNPEDDSAYYYLSLAHALMGKKKKACIYLEKAVSKGFDAAKAGQPVRKICL